MGGFADSRDEPTDAEAGQIELRDSADSVAKPSRATMEQLIGDYHGHVYRYAFRLSGSENDAEDLTQQTFLLAQTRFHQIRDLEKARQWLFAVVRSLFLKTLRKRKPQLAGNFDLELESPTVEPLTERIEREHLQVAISRLPDDYRLILLMFYFEESSYKQIAAQLDIKMGTVMSRLARAKARLRELLLELETPQAKMDES